MGGGSPRRFRLGLLAACAVPLCGPSCAKQRGNPPGTATASQPILNAAPGASAQSGSHGGAWVECQHRHAELASDALGPIVAHGLLEAPGYRPGLLSTEQTQEFAPARLHLDVAGESARVTWQDIALPAALPAGATLEQLVTGALALAGQLGPASEMTTEMHQEPGSVHQRRSWTFHFTQDGVPVVPGRCELSVQARLTGPAMLACRVPSAALVSFEPFAIGSDQAVRLAARALHITPRRVSADRIYLAAGRDAQARWQVTAYDGEREGLAVISGAGDVLAAGPDARYFTFQGYDLDSYNTGRANSAAKPGPVPEVTPVGVGDAQTTHLDSAPFETDRHNCTGVPDTHGPGDYAHGFVICDNDLLHTTDADHNPVILPLAAPRADGDFTNAASSSDPLGPQLHYLSTQIQSNLTLNGGYQLLAVPPPVFRPTKYTYYASGDAKQEAVAPVHDAELQAFYSAGKLQKFYSLLLGPSFPSGCNPGAPDCPADFTNAYVDAQGQDQQRLEITVHYQQGGAHAAAFYLDMNDQKATTDDGLKTYALDGTQDGFRFAHEYHHHVQFRLAQIANWQDAPLQTTKLDEHSRRRWVLEGMADGFGALATGRAVGGTLAEPGALPDPCADENNYPDATVGPEHNLCNFTTFGFWDDTRPDAYSQANVSQCYIPGLTSNHVFDGTVRPAITGAAVWGYEHWFLDAGVGIGVPGRQLLEAERGLKLNTDGEVDLLDNLVTYLVSLPDDADRRYVHLARTAFAEKGVFMPYVHQAFTPSGYDYRDHFFLPQCDFTHPCTGAQSGALESGTLTVTAPLKWQQGTTAPELVGFAPSILTYPHIYLDLSNRRGFPASMPGGIVTRTDSITLPADPPNCSLHGFFRRQASANSNWADVASAAMLNPDASGEPRVYYRLRLCTLPGPQGASCVSSSTVRLSATGPTYGVPAYTVITAGAVPPGCTLTCAIPVRGGSSRWPLALAASVLGLALLRRRRRG